jgi:threonine dehydratase
MQVSANDVARAADRISGFIVHTPLVPSQRLSDRLGLKVFLKPETLQPTGSFKIRGAMNALLQLDECVLANGVITASSGNHGPALAFAARRLGIACTVCLSEMVPANKVANVERNGGVVHLYGRDYDAAAAEAKRLAEDAGMTLIPAFDHPDIVAGAGTVGLEIMEDLPSVDTILVPLSGGGLLAGVAIAVKAASKAVRVIGVSMEEGASMHLSLKAGHPVDVAETESVADALGGSIGLDNCWTFGSVRDLADETVVVSEAAIADAMRRLFFDTGLVVEGAGAVGLAALFEDRVPITGRQTVVVATGRNVDMARFMDLVAGDDMDEDLEAPPLVPNQRTR